MSVFGLRRSDAPALIDVASGQSMSYRELLERGADAAAPLGQSKKLLFLLCRNDAFTAAAYSGALLAGHAVALLDASRPIEETAEILAAYRSNCLAGPSGLGSELTALGVPVVSITPLEGGEVVGLGYPPSTPLHPELAVLLSTSGSTGSRQFVRLNTQNLESNANAIADYLGLAPTDRPITSLPLHYTFGLSVLNSHWVAGAAVVLTNEGVMQRTFWDAFREYACSSLAGVPYTYLMLERIGFRQMDLPSLTILQQAGGALDRRLTALYAEFMESRRGRFFVMYGQTEATARMAYVPPDRLAEKLGSAGVAIPGGRLRIERSAPVPGENWPVGEVVYEGPNVMQGYATSMEDLALGDTLGGVLRTGDIGYIDADGYLFIVGRSKRIAKVYGLRVNLDEVEAMLRERGPSAVVAGDDAIWAFCAFGTDDSVAAIADELARRFRIHRSALHFKQVDAIPTMGSGKTDYQQVQQWTRR